MIPTSSEIQLGRGALAAPIRAGGAVRPAGRHHRVLFRRADPGRQRSPAQGIGSPEHPARLGRPAARRDIAARVKAHEHLTAADPDRPRDRPTVCSGRVSSLRVQSSLGTGLGDRFEGSRGGQGSSKERCLCGTKCRTCRETAASKRPFVQPMRSARILHGREGAQKAPSMARVFVRRSWACWRIRRQHVSSPGPHEYGTRRSPTAC